MTPLKAAGYSTAEYVGTGLGDDDEGTAFLNLYNDDVNYYIFLCLRQSII